MADQENPETPATPQSDSSPVSARDALNILWLRSNAAIAQAIANESENLCPRKFAVTNRPARDSY